MAWKKPLLSITSLAGGNINPYRFVAPGADDDHVVQASAGTDNILGVQSENVGVLAADDRVDFVAAGIGEVELAATLTMGAMVTSDANGAAVALGAGSTIAGQIFKGGTAGDVVPILLSRGVN